jgi:hypothetical protein
MSTMSTQSIGGVARQGSGRLAVASAIAFAVLFVVAMFLVAPVDTDQDDAGLISDVEDNSMAMMIGIYAGVLAALAFLVVAATLLRRLAAALVDADLTVARGAAMLGTVGLALGPAIIGSPGPADLFREEDRPLDAGFVRFIPHVGYITLMIVGALAIALFLGLLARAGQQSGLFPTWFVVLTYVAVVAMILAPAFIPMILLPIWALASAAVLAKPSATRVAPSPST